MLDDDPEHTGWLKQEGHYFQVSNKDQQLPPPSSLATAPAEVKALVKHVRSLASLAGVP